MKEEEEESLDVLEEYRELQEECPM